jgi:hypothetical protein
MEVIGQEIKFKAQARTKRPNTKSCIKCNIINNKYIHKIHLGFEVGLSLRMSNLTSHGVGNVKICLDLGFEVGLSLRMLNLTSHGVGNVKICLDLGFEVGLSLSMLNLASLIVSNLKYV